MLCAEHLTLTIGTAKILSGIDARIAPGRLTAIVGPNGAGKSSLLKCLAGLLVPSSGKVGLDGADLARLAARERGRRIGYLPQHAALHWDITVRELVRLGRFAHGDMDSEAGTAAVDAAMADVGLEQLADRRSATLSGGERARALLARVLAGQPQWILADEPFAALDIAHRHDMVDRLKAIAHQGVGVVVVDHDLTLLERVADDVLLLDGGRVSAAGRARDVLVPARLGPVFAAAFTYASTSAGEPLLVNDPAGQQRGRLAGGATGANLRQQPHGAQPDNTAGGGDGTT